MVNFAVTEKSYQKMSAKFLFVKSDRLELILLGNMVLRIKAGREKKE